MTRRLVAVGVLGALAVLILVLAAGFRRDPKDIRGGSVGRPAPSFDLPMLDGPQRFTLSEALAAGHPVVVNFWATWCLECRREHPMMVRVWERYRASEVQMVGIIFQDEPGLAREYMRSNGGSWPNLIDDGSRVALRFGVYGVPETYFIRPDGTIAGRQVGAMSEQEFIDGIEAIRAQAPVR